MTVATVLRGLRLPALIDGDRRLEAFDQIDVRPFELMEKLPGVNREAFDILPLPFGVQRIEGQRTLAGAARTGQHHQAVARNIDVEILQIMHPCPADADALVRLDSNFGTLPIHAVLKRVECGDLKLFSIAGSGADGKIGKKRLETEGIVAVKWGSVRLAAEGRTMSYLGRVKNGVIVFDKPIDLPNGTRVKIELLPEPTPKVAADNALTLYEHLRSVAGKARGLPPDAPLRVDHYLYRTPEIEEIKWVRLLRQFIVGVLFLLFGSLFLCDKSLPGFASTFALLSCTLVLAVTLGLIWFTRWAMRKDSRFGQFSISTLLLMLFYAGLYCGIIRWLTLNSSFGETSGTPDNFMAFWRVATVFTVFSVVAIPFVINMTESLLWFAVWLQRRPAIHRLVRPFLSRRSK